jgi:hypothetical protein
VAAEAFRNAGYDATTAAVDVYSRQSVHGLTEVAMTLGNVIGVIHAAGVSPSQASPATILAVDLVRHGGGPRGVHHRDCVGRLRDGCSRLRLGMPPPMAVGLTLVVRSDVPAEQESPPLDVRDARLPPLPHAARPRRP